MARNMPGHFWRFLVHRRPDDGEPLHLYSTEFGPSEFDELVVGDPCWLHVEQMNNRDWWMQVGPAVIRVHINTDHTVDVYIEDEGPSNAGLVAEWRKNLWVEDQ